MYYRVCINLPQSEYFQLRAGALLSCTDATGHLFPPPLRLDVGRGPAGGSKTEWPGESSEVR